MATSTLIKRLNQLADARGAPKGIDSGHFQAFLKASAPQLRTAFCARHSEEEVFDILCTMLVTAQKLSSDPLVELQERDSGTGVADIYPNI